LYKEKYYIIKAAKATSILNTIARSLWNVVNEETGQTGRKLGENIFLQHMNKMDLCPTKKL
jgi:hypothetical protein